jgi:hypothetical protein
MIRNALVDLIRGALIDDRPAIISLLRIALIGLTGLQ